MMRNATCNNVRRGLVISDKWCTMPYVACMTAVAHLEHSIFNHAPWMKYVQVWRHMIHSLLGHIKKHWTKNWNKKRMILFALVCGNQAEVGHYTYWMNQRKKLIFTKKKATRFISQKKILLFFLNLRP